MNHGSSINRLASQTTRSLAGARQAYNFTFLAMLGLVVYAFAVTALAIPSAVRTGWQGQAAIRLLDEMRRPLVAMKGAQDRMLSANGPVSNEELDDAIRAGRVSLAKYLEAARYNTALKREVQALSRAFERWVSAQNRLAREWINIRGQRVPSAREGGRKVGRLFWKYVSLSSEEEALFLATMNTLSDGELPIHADIESGRKAGVVLFILSAVLAVYLAGLLYFDQRMRARIREEIWNKELRLHRLAHFDTLTGLPNRVLFDDRLVTAMAAARREGTRASVLFVDLDGFKQINDGFGHDAGDKLLKETAKRLSSCVREVDTVARLGGDEFVIVLGNINNPAVSIAIAKMVGTSLHRPFKLGGNEVRIGASIGIAHYPDDGETYESLVRAADSAMYRAKKSGKGSYGLASELAPVPVSGAALFEAV